MFDTPALRIHKYNYTPTNYDVEGKSATKNEWNVAQAFTKLEIGFLFQVSYWGGHVIVGGQVLDFLAFTPRPVPVQVYGNYWHRGQMSSKDKYNEIQIQLMVGTLPIILWGDETETVEAAIIAVKKKVI